MLWFDQKIYLIYIVYLPTYLWNWLASLTHFLYVSNFSKLYKKRLTQIYVFRNTGVAKHDNLNHKPNMSWPFYNYIIYHRAFYLVPWTTSLNWLDISRMMMAPQQALQLVKLINFRIQKFWHAQMDGWEIPNCFHRLPPLTWEWFVRTSGRNLLLKVCTWQECWLGVSSLGQWLIGKVVGPL